MGQRVDVIYTRHLTTDDATAVAKLGYKALHETGLFGVDYDETHFYKLSELFPGWFDHINFSPYELHSGDNFRPEEKKRINQGGYPAPSLDRWPGSTGGTAAGWLSKYTEYRDFILMGCDPEGGYNPIFVGAGHKDGEKGFNGQGTAEQPSHLYQGNYDIITNFITSYGGRARHINEVSIEEQKDLGLL